MSTIKFRLAAKTDMGLVRTNNEDNFQVISDLSSGKMQWVNNEICSLGEKGTLLAVADGMGGMNAGEVASGLVIETIRESFSVENLTPDITKNRFSIEKYMNDVIVAADTRIKQMAKSHPETRGMGTTIVIGWIYDGNLYVSWCGDSRAYVYNPSAGLHQITKDHSYVQSLIDKGAITREDAFDFPDSNIITRSLGDTSSKAKPESLLKPYKLCDNDIVLLCTDGLNGMLRDQEIESVIRGNEHNMDRLADELIQAACDAEGSDNITICLCQILQGGAVCDPAVFNEMENRLNGGRKNTVQLSPKEDDKPKAKKGPYIIIACLSLIIIGLISAWYFMRQPKEASQNGNDKTMLNDSTEMNSRHEESTTRDENNNEGNKETSNDGVSPKKDNGGQNGEQDKNREDVENNKKDSPANNPAKEGAAKEEPTKDGPAPIDPAQKDPEAKENKEELTPIGENINGEKDKEKEIAKEPPMEKEEEPYEEYVVQPGDTYYHLSDSFKISKEKLLELNKNKPLKIGEKIKIPKRNKNNKN